MSNGAITVDHSRQGCSAYGRGCTTVYEVARDVFCYISLSSRLLIYSRGCDGAYGAVCIAANWRTSLSIYSPYASLGELVLAKPFQNRRDEHFLPSTLHPMDKTTHRELSPVEKGMGIALF